MNALRGLFLFAGLGLSACLEVEQTVVLQPDGSGSQTVAMRVRESTLEDLQRTSAAAQLGASSNPAVLFDKEVVGAELRSAGLTMLAHVTQKQAGKRSVTVEATFPDFATLQKSPLGGSGVEWVLDKGPKEGTAKLTMYPQGRAAWLEARAKAEQLAVQADPVAMEFFRKRQQQWTGLSIVARFQVPGDVLLWTRTLAKTGPREVTATITPATLQSPEDLVRWLAPRFEVVFDSSGCKLPVP
ncbi:MAG: hypothetical protein JNK49_08065 [Planctomycetes bacterium]|nr:hypothetical protein [Planctomycetota bacterium]